MREFEFTLTFSVPETTEVIEQFVERLGENGCNDAIVGIGHKGRIAIQFTREANDAGSAVTTAIEDVKRAIPNAELLESSPDLADVIKR